MVIRAIVRMRKAVQTTEEMRRKTEPHGPLRNIPDAYIPRRCLIFPEIVVRILGSQPGETTTEWTMRAI